MNTCLMPYCKGEVIARGDVCDDCWDDRRGQLASLPDLYVATFAQLTPGANKSDIYGIDISRVDPAVPIDLQALTALAYSYQRLARWLPLAGQLADVKPPVEVPAHRSTGRHFFDAVRFLQLHDNRFSTASYAGEYVTDVWKAYRELVTRCVSTSPRHLNCACPTCSTWSVVSRHADEYAVCLTCGNEWSHSQLPKLRRTVSQGTA